jgi:hypothetical protein
MPTPVPNVKKIRGGARGRRSRGIGKEETTAEKDETPVLASKRKRTRSKRNPVKESGNGSDALT